MENVWLTGCVSAQESQDLPQWRGVCLTEIRLPPSGTILIRKRLGSWRPLVLSHRQGWCFPSWCCWTFSKPWPQHTRGLRLFQGFGYNLQWSGQCCHFSRQLSPTMSSSTTAPRFSQFSGWTLCLLFFFFFFFFSLHLKVSKDCSSFGSYAPTRLDSLLSPTLSHSVLSKMDILMFDILVGHQSHDLNLWDGALATSSILLILRQGKATLPFLSVDTFWAQAMG